MGCAVTGVDCCAFARLLRRISIAAILLVCVLVVPAIARPAQGSESETLLWGSPVRLNSLQTETLDFAKFDQQDGRRTLIGVKLSFNGSGYGTYRYVNLDTTAGIDAPSNPLGDDDAALRINAMITVSIPPVPGSVLQTTATQHFERGVGPLFPYDTVAGNEPGDATPDTQDVCLNGTGGACEPPLEISAMSACGVMSTPACSNLQPFILDLVNQPMSLTVGAVVRYECTVTAVAPQKFSATGRELNSDGSVTIEYVFRIETGACCLPSGACMDALLPAECTALEGTFRGAGSDCNTLDPPCPQPWACCFANAGTPCADLLEDRCRDLGGEPLVGSHCSDMPCPGACCLPNGTCILATAAVCNATECATFHGSGTRCTDAGLNCEQPRACCLANGSCVMALPCECDGTSLAPGSTCANNPCVGACCMLDGRCVSTTRALCTSVACQIFHGEGVQCAQVTCEQPRACCLPGNPSLCQNMLPCSCIAAQGTPMPIGVMCASDTCVPQTGACCLSNGACAILTQAACEATPCQTFMGLGTLCSGVTCVASSVQACCFAGTPSTCMMLTACECTASGGTPRDPGTTCLDPMCDPATTRACCLTNGVCDVLTPTSCASVGGTVQSEGVTCLSAPCSSECQCYWRNGDQDGRNAVVSESNVLVPLSATADDVIVPAGNVLLAREFCGTMVTNDLFRVTNWYIDTPEARLDVYEDCNGRPDSLITSFSNPEWEVVGNAPFGSPGQWAYVKFCFDVSELRLDASTQERRFWVSLVGVGDMQPGERYFWATSKSEPTTTVQGVQGYMHSEWVDGFSDWRAVEDTNADCHDFAFQLCGDLVGVIANNGTYSLDCGVKALNTTNFRTKVADNFQVEPCAFADVREVTTWIATNVTPTQAHLEMYTNDCEQPAFVVPQTAILSVKQVVDSGGLPAVFNSPVSGSPLHVFELRWSVTPGTVLVSGGRNYWIAAYVSGASDVSQEAYVLCKSDFDCSIAITQAKYLAAPFAVDDWTDVSILLGMERDMAFQVLGVVHSAVQPAVFASPERRLEPATLGSRDVNGDGVVDLQDAAEILRRMGTQPTER